MIQIIQNANLIHLERSFWKYLGYDALYTGRYLHQGLVNWWSWCQDQTMQDQDQRSKITVNYLDSTKDRDQWQRSWRSRSKIDDLPHLWRHLRFKQLLTPRGNGWYQWLVGSEMVLTPEGKILHQMSLNSGHSVRKSAPKSNRGRQAFIIPFRFKTDMLR